METIANDFDLNALRLIVALGETRNVTRAAELLGMSQSGFSTALARLRERLGNPLFVRTHRGMEATPRAAKMIETSREILRRVKVGVLEEDDFDPLREKAHFSLSMADVAEVVFLPRLLAHLSVAAPRVTLQSASHRKEALQEEMEVGRVDLALGYFPEFGGDAFFQQRLYTHTYACMLRLKHPALANPFTKEVYLSLGHAMVMSPSRSNDLFESFLAGKRFERNIVARTPHHLSLPSIVSETDLIATVPMATAMYFAHMGAVAVAPLPFKPPVFGVQQHWHTRANLDPRHRWLRQQIHALFNDSTDRWHVAEREFYGDIRGRVG